jgi:electron transport complex, RnfABCDGE type, C subunit
VFPSAVKLDPGASQHCPTLIVNGGECEPWISCDDLLMRHHAAEILQGTAIMRHLLGSTDVLVGIEDNKPEAIAAMRAAAATLDFAVAVVAVPSLYPGGGAKQMIETLTGRQVPSGKLSTDIGIQVFNVGTAYALARAVHHGEPLISRLVTVTGHVLRPQNVETLIGTPMQALIELAGERDGATGVLMGGPMMGLPLADPGVPVVKATNCVLVKSTQLFPPLPAARPCIRCTRCADACPAEAAAAGTVPLRQAGDFGRRRNTTCSTASNAAAAATSAPAISRWSTSTATPRARSGRARRKSAPPTWRARGTNSASSGSNAKSGKRPKSSPPRPARRGRRRRRPTPRPTPSRR